MKSGHLLAASSSGTAFDQLRGCIRLGKIARMNREDRFAQLHLQGSELARQSGSRLASRLIGVPFRDRADLDVAVAVGQCLQRLGHKFLPQMEVAFVLRAPDGSFAEAFLRPEQLLGGVVEGLASDPRPTDRR